MNFEKPKSVTEKVGPRIQGDLSAAFDRNKDGTERVADFWLRLNPILEGVDASLLESIKSNLDQCAAIEDKEEFVARAFAAIAPILTPEIFPKVEETARRKFNEGGGRIELSKILSYSTDSRGDRLHLHWAPSRNIPLEERLELLLAGMQRLAAIVQADLTIKRVEASSWIVAKMPDLLTGGGFTIDGEMDPAEREKYFPNVQGPINTAHIDREELLARYFTKNNQD